ncbi:MAG TPA: FHA domain-containing protein [Phycisphaerae bacterium]|jgi:hypothetical protein
MDCRIKIIAGPENGQEFVCAGPETYIGRSQRCAVRLTGSSVSFEHAVISRAGDDFFAENLSANGTWLNNERLTAKTRLRTRDQIRLGTGGTGGGETVIRIESLPAAATPSSSRRWILVTFVILLVALLVVVIADPFSSDETKDWAKAYRTLLAFAQDQAEKRQLPAEIPGMMSEAWRLEAAGDHADAMTQWTRIYVILNDFDKRQNWESSGLTDHYWQSLKNGESLPADDDALRTALERFVKIKGRSQ